MVYRVVHRLSVGNSKSLVYVPGLSVFCFGVATYMYMYIVRVDACWTNLVNMYYTTPFMTLLLSNIPLAPHVMHLHFLVQVLWSDELH